MHGISLQDPHQKDILSYFEESFFEDDLTEADMVGMEQQSNKEAAPKARPMAVPTYRTPPRNNPRKGKLTPSPGLSLHAGHIFCSVVETFSL